LNISSIRFVITNPPETFTKASNTDNAPSAWGKVCGTRPPPMMKNPPTPTMPTMISKLTTLLLDLSYLKSRS
jgi:hypothetical protein